MITLLIDPQGKFKTEEKYLTIDYTELPKSFASSTEIHGIIMSKSLDGSDKYILIDGVDKLDEKKSALLTRILTSKPDSTYILLTARSEESVSKHILNLAPIVKRIRGTTATKERSVWQNLKMSYMSRRIPADDEMPLLLKSVVDTRTVSEPNRELAAELDCMLFKTHTRYLAVAWAGLHKKQSVSIVIKSFKKKENKQKVKKQPKPNKIKKAKKKAQKSLEDYL